jgi:DNA polymerase-1
MKALIDGDILLYKIGYTSENEEEDVALSRLDELMSRILDTVKADSYMVYLSCGREDSFRAKLNPKYKAHRKQEKPLHYNALKEHLKAQWHAVQAVEEEADDLIGIAQTENHNTIACTIDKDILYGLEGNKYNFVKEEMFYTSQEEATLFFYKQLLMGDKADNILGIPGIGPVKASKILEDSADFGEEVLYTTVVDAYRNWLKDEWADRYSIWTLNEEKQMLDLITLSGIQLKIRTYVGEIWRPPYDGMDIGEI